MLKESDTLVESYLLQNLNRLSGCQGGSSIDCSLHKGSVKCATTRRNSALLLMTTKCQIFGVRGELPLRGPCYTIACLERKHS